MRAGMGCGDAIEGAKQRQRRRVYLSQLLHQLRSLRRPVARMKVGRNQCKRRHALARQQAQTQRRMVLVVARQHAEALEPQPVRAGQRLAGERMFVELFARAQRNGDRCQRNQAKALRQIVEHAPG